MNGVVCIVIVCIICYKFVWSRVGNYWYCVYVIVFVIVRVWIVGYGRSNGVIGIVIICVVGNIFCWLCVGSNGCSGIIK